MAKFAAVPAAALLLTGCMGMQWGPGHAPNGMAYKGIINGYASAEDLRDYDGTILQFDVVDDRQPDGELVNLDLWPIVGVGVGALGLRAHIGPLGAGFGTLFYEPGPQSNWWDSEGETSDFEVK